MNILLLDPPGSALDALKRILSELVGPIHSVARGDDLLHTIRSELPVDLVILDASLGDGSASGLSLIAAVRAADPHLPLVATAASGTVASTAEAIATGANDFLVRGPELRARVQTLLDKIRHLIRLHAQRHRLLAERFSRYQLIGRSPQIRALLDQIHLVAAIPRPVLVIGERGTGKELVAWNLHAAAGAPDRPMISVNCAVFTDSLLESELFGHDKGAYTGADHVALGRFEQADGGTLFLDEIGSMSRAFQQKILRTVEYGVFTRVGGSRERHTSARIIAATNADLQQRIREGSFLADLYDRLAFEVISVPPLRERTEDIALLAQHFLDRFIAEVPSLRGRALSPGAIQALERYPFPGNIRELKHIIERAAYRDSGAQITAADLGLSAHTPPLGGGFAAQVEALKQQLITEALAAAGGNQAQAARELGLTYDQYRYYLRKYQ